VEASSTPEKKLSLSGTDVYTVFIIRAAK